MSEKAMVADRPMSPVEQEFSRIDSSIAAINNLISELGVRLSPIRKKSEPQPENKVSEATLHEVDVSDVRERQITIHEALVRSQSRITDILESLEI
jgi:hypothetical protein